MTEGISTSRRDLLRGGATLAAMAATPAVISAQAQAQTGTQTGAPTTPSDIITRRIPSTSEVLPAIGLGTFLTFDRIPGTPRAELGEVLRIYWEGGARAIDTSPLYGTGESTVGAYATALGISERMFVANKIWATGDFLADDGQAARSLRISAERLWREQIDLMQCHSLVNVDVVVPLLRAWKKEGRIRYVGATHFENAYAAPLLDWVRRGNLDVVQVNYSIFNRYAEEALLPAAAERGIAVLVNMPFEKARLFKVVEGRAVPDFARAAGMDTWATFFLKWVIAHPAVTAALPATANPQHAAENIAALRGPLPDPDMRARMLRHMETIPGFADIGRMPWYPGKRYPGIIGRAQAELRARA